MVKTCLQNTRKRCWIHYPTISETSTRFERGVESSYAHEHGSVLIALKANSLWVLVEMDDAGDTVKLPVVVVGENQYPADRCANTVDVLEDREPEGGEGPAIVLADVQNPAKEDMVPVTEDQLKIIKNVEAASPCTWFLPRQKRLCRNTTKRGTRCYVHKNVSVFSVVLRNRRLIRVAQLEKYPEKA